MTININDDNVISATDTGNITNHFVTVDVKYNYKGGVFYHKGSTEVHVFNCDDDDVRNNGCEITKQRALEHVRSTLGDEFGTRATNAELYADVIHF